MMRQKCWKVEQSTIVENRLSLLVGSSDDVAKSA